MDIFVANVEQGMPTVEQAKLRLDQAIRTAKSKKCTALKVIHGYGSSGKGGAIRREMQSLFASYKESGRIQEFAAGEEFSPFYDNSRRMVDRCPALARDRDYLAANHGISIVLL